MKAEYEERSNKQTPCSDANCSRNVPKAPNIGRHHSETEPDAHTTHIWPDLWATDTTHEATQFCNVCRYFGIELSEENTMIANAYTGVHCSHAVFRRSPVTR